MRIGLISLIVLLILPASYSAVTLTIEQARKEGIKQFVGKEFANYTVINQVYKSSNNESVSYTHLDVYKRQHHVYA